MRRQEGQTGDARLHVRSIWKEREPAVPRNDDSVLGPADVGRWSYAASKALDERLALAYHGSVACPSVYCGSLTLPDRGKPGVTGWFCQHSCARRYAANL